MKFCESFDLAMAASVNQDDLLEVLENEEGDTNSGESGEEDGTDADSDEESDGDDGEDVAGVDFSSKKSWTCHAIHGRIPGSSIGISKLIQLVSITKNNNVL